MDLQVSFDPGTSLGGRDGVGILHQFVYSYVDDEVSLIHDGATNHAGFKEVELARQETPRARRARRAGGPGDAWRSWRWRSWGPSRRLQRRRRPRPGWQSETEPSASDGTRQRVCRTIGQLRPEPGSKVRSSQQKFHDMPHTLPEPESFTGVALRVWHPDLVGTRGRPQEPSLQVDCAAWRRLREVPDLHQALSALGLLGPMGLATFW